MSTKASMQPRHAAGPGTSRAPGPLPGGGLAPALAAAGYRSYILPWDVSLAEEQRLRQIGKQVAIATLVLMVLFSLLPVPEMDSSVPPPVPPRLARLVLEKPTPPPPVQRELPRPEPEVRPEPVAPTEKTVERTVQPVTPDTRVQAREKASRAGLLPFVDQLAELRDSQALESITSGATTYTGAVGDAPRVERSLITARAGAGSGGINTAALSRNTGGAGLGGRETTKVASGVAALGGGGAGPAEEGGGSQRAGRSREEIEMVFDKNKSAIFALYNRALRSNPALQGKLVLKLTIEASGEVSDCSIVSSELDDPELERKLVARVKMFRFQSKDVPPVTTTKPIDFFPA